MVYSTREAALRDEVVVGAEARRSARSSKAGQAQPVAPLALACAICESRAEPGAEVRRAGRDRIVDHHPGHVALRVDLEPHAQRRRRGCQRPGARALDRRDASCVIR